MSSPPQERNLKNQFISMKKCSHLASLYNSCTFGNFQFLLNPSVSCAEGRLGSQNFNYLPLSLMIHVRREVRMVSSHPDQDGNKWMLIQYFPPSLR